MTARFALAVTLLAAARAAAQAVKTPWPEPLSTKARAGLAANDARPPESATIDARRARAKAIRQAIGQVRLNRYTAMVPR